MAVPTADEWWMVDFDGVLVFMVVDSRGGGGVGWWLCLCAGEREELVCVLFLCK